VCMIALHDGVRELIDFAKSHDMDVVLVSQNDPEPVKEAIRALDLHFDREYIGYMDKFETIARDMQKYDIDRAYFVDDVYGRESFAERAKSYYLIEDRVELYDDIGELIERWL